VRQLLHDVLAAWERKNGVRPDLRRAHGNDFVGDHAFLGWETKEELQRAVARVQDDPNSYPLIEPGKPARETFLVLALTTGVPIEPGVNYPPMPIGGPLLAPDQVEVIVRWIEAGMPD
jgi:hypothetical protein